MINVSVNFNEAAGVVKPMHAVNNGPVCRVGEQFQGWNDTSNLNAFVAAGIPYARTHDSSGAAHAYTHAYADTYAHAHTSTHAYTHTYAHADADTEAHTYAYTDSEAHTYAYTDSVHS